MAKSAKKSAAEKAPETAPATPTPAPVEPPKPLTVNEIIKLGAVDVQEHRNALRKAVKSTRTDLFADADPTNPSHADVRYGNGRAFKQRPNEIEATLFANSRKLTLALLDKVETVTAELDKQTAKVTELGEQVKKLTADAAEGQAKLTAMTGEAEAAKAELAKVAGELAVLKATPAQATA